MTKGKFLFDNVFENVYENYLFLVLLTELSEGVILGLDVVIQ